MAYDPEDDEEDIDGESAPTRPQVAPVTLPPAPSVSASPPAMPVVSSMPPVQRPTPQESGAARIAQIGARPDPNAPQYQPVKPSLGNQILGRIAAGLVGFRNPEAGVAVRRHQEQAPILAAQQKFATDEGNYNQNFNQALQQNAAEEEAPLKEAETAHLGAETNALNNPTAKLENVQQGYAGAISDALKRGVDPTTDPHVMAWKQAAEDIQKESAPKEGELPLGESAANLNKTLQNEYQVLHPGKTLPPEYSVTPKSTQKDYERVAGSLKNEESAVGTKAQRDAAAASRTDKENNKVGDKFDEANAAQASKDVATAHDADFRWRSMNDSYPKALKGDQQAMMNLLTNHIGMTLGLQKGARITKDILQEAQKSAPWLQSIEAKFDDRGYLSGLTLTPESMKQMMELGSSQRLDAWERAHDSAGQAGVDDKVKYPDDVRGKFGGGSGGPPSGAKVTSLDDFLNGKK